MKWLKYLSYSMVSVLLIIIVGCKATSDIDGMISEYEKQIILLDGKLAVQNELLLSQEATITELNCTLDNRNTEIDDLKIRLNEAISINADQKNEIKQLIESNEQNLEIYPEIIYDSYPTPSDSGLRIYSGDIGIRSYPSDDAAIIFPASHMDSKYLNCIATIAMGPSESWAIVMANDWGRTKIGYVPYSELERHNPEYTLSEESIGGIHIGDRIETMIGLINKDYYIVSDLEAIYIFPKYIYGTVDDETFGQNDEITSFVTNDFHISYLRTSSPDYMLSSGYGVGQNAIETLEFYKNKYKISDYDDYVAWGTYTFEIADGEYLSFDIDESELTESAKISKVYLRKNLDYEYQ